jgi:serine/threonine-protein kinase
MSDQSRLDELLLRHEELRIRGEAVAPEELCRACPELLGELKRQIASLAAMDALLDPSSDAGTPTPQEGPDAAGASAPAGLEGPLPAGTSYRVLRLHARGGLGEVFVAHDERLRREVALKRLQARQAGNADSRSRFLREAEITSRLEHPNVVPIHAVGRDGAGHLFYTMRLVQGETLHEAIQRWHAADKPGRDPSERRLEFRRLVGRFVAVCHTVAYAHSRGILHRDIKPNNILLGPYGETLLVDWGLAKVLAAPGAAAPETGAPTEPGDADGEAATQVGSVLGTPAYMSPEQAAGQWDLLGPASDIYSLGATLYVLLTGQPAFTGRHVGDVLEKVRRGQFRPPRQYVKSVPRALEAICLKAMARQPEARYAGAEALATDLEHWLADAPVSAWREPWHVRAGRWLRRHKALATGAVVLLVTALAALAVSNVLVRREQEETAAQKRQAEVQRDRADENLALARKAVEDYFTHVAEDDDLKKQDLHRLRKKLLATAVPFLTRFTRQQADDPALLAEQGKTLYLLARLRAELGETTAAIADYEAMRAIFTKLVRTHPGVADHRQQLVRSHHNLAHLYWDVGRLPAAEASYRQAQRLQERLALDYPKNPEYQRNLALSHGSLGQRYQERGKVHEADTCYRRARAILARLVRREPKVALYQQDLASALHDQAGLYHKTNRLADAENYYRQAREVQDKLVRQHPDVPLYRQELAQTHHNLGRLYRDMQRLADAEASYRRSLDMRQKLTRKYQAIPRYLQELAQSQHDLASLCFSKRLQKETVTRGLEALAIRRDLASAHPAVIEYRQEMALSLRALGVYYKAARQARPAEAYFREALKTHEQLARERAAGPQNQQELALSRYHLGELLSDTGRLTEARPLVTQAIRDLEIILKREARNAFVRQYLRNAHWVRARTSEREQRYAEALPDWDRAVTLATGVERDLVRLQRAVTLVHLGDLARATDEANALADRTPAPNAVLLHAAMVFALASGAVAQDSRLPAAERNERAQAYAGRSVQLLEQARANGYFKTAAHVNQLENTRELDPLRSRPEFKKLLNGLREEFQSRK